MRIFFVGEERRDKGVFGLSLVFGFERVLIGLYVPMFYYVKYFPYVVLNEYLLVEKVWCGVVGVMVLRVEEAAFHQIVFLRVSLDELFCVIIYVLEVVQEEELEENWMRDWRK